MPLLAALLALDAVLHAVVVARHGFRGNLAFAVFAFVYVALALGVLFETPHALRVSLVVTAAGMAALTFAMRTRPTTRAIDRAIWLNDGAVLICGGYLLWAG